jgi:hypothetical protein
MRMNVSLGAGAPISAAGHFRGVSSFRDCTRRKSLTIKLAGSKARRVQPGSATSHLYLISMCVDHGYIKTHLANTLARFTGVYRLPQRYVRVVLAHSNATLESLGVYLLIEDPDITFVKGAAALASVVRRRVDPERATAPEKGTPSVKLPSDSNDAPATHTPEAAAALKRYDLLVETGMGCDTADTACYDQLTKLMDIDMFIRWMAFCNFVGVRCICVSFCWRMQLLLTRRTAL